MKIVLQNLTKKFPNRNRKVKEDVVAVDNFTFEIPDGKLVGLLGPSGCGKSTTLNLLSGLLKPSAGKISFGEDDVTNLPPENRGVGLVFQNYALYPHLTVMQNIIFPLQNLKGKNKLTKAEMAEKANEWATDNAEELEKLAKSEDEADKKAMEIFKKESEKLSERVAKKTAELGAGLGAGLLGL